MFVSVVAYPARFTFQLVAIARPGGPDLLAPPPGQRDAEAPLVGLLFSDGTKLTSYGWRPGRRDKPDSPQLLEKGAGGSPDRFAWRFVCTHLPTSGPLLFVCSWPQHGIDESSVEIDGSLIVDAAGQAEPIWLDDVDLPE